MIVLSPPPRILHVLKWMGVVVALQLVVMAEWEATAGVFDTASWCAFLVIAPATAFLAWYIRSRATAVREWRTDHGLCVACGYDLRGNVSGRCPECGKKI